MQQRQVLQLALIHLLLCCEELQTVNEGLVLGLGQVGDVQGFVHEGVLVLALVLDALLPIIQDDGPAQLPGQQQPGVYK